MADYLKKSPLLQVKNLSTSFFIDGSPIKVIDDINFKIIRGETLGIIGESGCGKTVTSLSIMRLIPKGLGMINSGSVSLDGREILNLPIEEFRKVRGKEISMIFQDPMTSLNPVLNIGDQVSEVLKIHTDINDKEALERVVELLEIVGIPDPSKQLKNYPHQLSGGMKQRIMIAMALSLRPKLLIADEPTTALDVTIQAQIIQLLKKLKSDHQMSMMMITHDLGVVAQSCDFVIVMYAGKIVESAKVNDLFSSPKHPYTFGLMKSIISIMETDSEKLYTIDGMVPALGKIKAGCSFANRCSYQKEKCHQESPKLQKISTSHSTACHYPLNLTD